MSAGVPRSPPFLKSPASSTSVGHQGTLEGRTTTTWLAVEETRQSDGKEDEGWCVLWNVLEGLDPTARCTESSTGNPRPAEWEEKQGRVGTHSLCELSHTRTHPSEVGVQGRVPRGWDEAITMAGEGLSLVPDTPWTKDLWPV
jgi:hypothetical protein